jgi:hypothetical protein
VAAAKAKFEAGTEAQQADGEQENEMKANQTGDEVKEIRKNECNIHTVQ